MAKRLINDVMLSMTESTSDASNPTDPVTYQATSLATMRNPAVATDATLASLSKPARSSCFAKLFMPLFSLMPKPTLSKNVVQIRTRLKTGTWSRQKFDFFSTRFSPQDLVAVWIASKLLDDLLVADLEIQVILDSIFSI